jgi:uncharacterized membrane protein YfcA
LDYILYLSVGALAGFLSGLFGLGGGIIIVPALIFVFTANGLPLEVITHLAIGTSLATIVITSIASTYTHHQKDSVLWGLTRWLIPGLLLGSILGGLLAASLSGSTLQLLFGALMIVVAMQLLVSQDVGTIKTPGKFHLSTGGIFIGTLSSLLGIGGGTLTTPFLASFGIKIRQAVATSAACGLPIAIAGSATYLVTGMNSTLVPEGSLGYIFIPAWLGIVLTSMPFARVGALLAHRINERRLKQLFAGIILILGVRFIWLNALVTLGN